MSETITGPADHAAAATLTRVAAWRGAGREGRSALGWFLAGAVLLPLAIIAMGAVLAWRQAWREAETEIARAADAAAEYAGRVLDTHRLLAARMDDLLHGLSDAEIRAREAALHAELGRLVAGHPGLSGFVIDRAGHALLAARLYPVPRTPSFADREFHRALRQPDAPETHVSRVFVGRVDANVFFSVSRRRTATANGLPAGEFDGLVNVSVYPRDLAPGLRRILGTGNDVVALVRMDGEVLARSTGLDAPVPPLPAEAPLMRAIARGEPRALAEGLSAIAEGRRLSAARRVEGWPVYAIATRPRAAIVARWREHMAWQLPVGVAATLLLLLLALVVRRQQAGLRAANADLEGRVQARTRELAASEERLRLAQEAARIGSWEVDPQTWQAAVSASQAQLYGLPAGAPPHGLGWESWLSHVHPEDRARVEAAARRAIETGRSYAEEFRIRRADTGEERWIQARGRWAQGSAGSGARFVGVNIDVTESKAAEAALAASEAEFRAIFENSVVGKAQADPVSLRLIRVNACFCEILGHAEEELLGGMTFLDLTHPEDRAENEAGFRAAMAAGRPYRVETRLVRKDGGIRWVIVAAALLPAAAGRPARTIAAVQDITERHRAEERQMLLAREVDHRSKNALAVVQAALRLTPKNDVVTFAGAIEGRVGALARAQTLLAAGRWTGADLRTLIEAELAGFMGHGNGSGDDAPHARLDGPPLAVSAEAAQPLSMALHELATNATKYGALSASRGVVAIAWQPEPAEGRLLLRWAESGGPPLPGAPAGTGFGSRVLKATMRQLGGTIALDWRPSGLLVEMRLPLAQFTPGPGSAAMDDAAAEDRIGSGRQAG